MFNMLVPGIEANVTTAEIVKVLALYGYVAFAQMTLARRLGIPMRDAWLAWLPFANIYLLTRMADVPWWYGLGIFIPFLNVALVGVLWSQIGTRLKKPFWVGLLVMLPYVGTFVPGYFVLDQTRRVS